MEHAFSLPTAGMPRSLKQTGRQVICEPYAFPHLKCSSRPDGFKNHTPFWGMKSKQELQSSTGKTAAHPQGGAADHSPDDKMLTTPSSGLAAERKSGASSHQNLHGGAARIVHRNLPDSEDAAPRCAVTSRRPYLAANSRRHRCVMRWHAACDIKTHPQSVSAGSKSRRADGRLKRALFARLPQENDEVSRIRERADSFGVRTRRRRQSRSSRSTCKVRTASTRGWCFTFTAGFGMDGATGASMFRIAAREMELSLAGSRLTNRPAIVSAPTTLLLP